MPTYLFFIDGAFESQHASRERALDALCHYGAYPTLRIFALDMADPGKSEDVTADLVRACIDAGHLDWQSDLAREQTPRSVSLTWWREQLVERMYGGRP